MCAEYVCVANLSLQVALCVRKHTHTHTECVGEFPGHAWISIVSLYHTQYIDTHFFFSVMSVYIITLIFLNFVMKRLLPYVQSV